MTINKLPTEILLQICTYLTNDKDKFNLLICNKELSRLLTVINLDNMYNLANVHNKHWYQQITKLKNISIDDLRYLPKNLNTIEISKRSLSDLPSIPNYNNLHTIILFDISVFATKLKNLPPRLHTLIFNARANINSGDIPESVRVLEINNYVEMESNALPKKLDKLTINTNYVSSIPTGTNYIHTLEFGPTFDRILYPGDLPDNIHNIKFGYDRSSNFNSPIHRDVLPSTLHTLEFGSKFNQIIAQRVLPASLHALKFSYFSSFNQKLLNVLPENLNTLIFGWEFNTPLNYGTQSILPKKLKLLKFGHNFDQPIEYNVLPDCLHTLEFGEQFNQLIGVCVLSKNLRNLKFGDAFARKLLPGVLPDNLRTLIFSANSRYSSKIHSGDLPKKLHTLKLGRNYIRKIKAGALPSSLHTLLIGNDLFEQILYDKLLPENLQVLQFYTDFDRKIDLNLLPNSLKIIKCSRTYLYINHLCINTKNINIKYY